jgi:hypothetical protein
VILNSARIQSHGMDCDFRVFSLSRFSLYSSRLRLLWRDPLCKIARLCRGFVRSTDADHIIPICAGGPRFSLSNGRDSRFSGALRRMSRLPRA